MQHPAPPQATLPATQPATQPATSPATAPVPPATTWIEVVRRNDGSIATTQPLKYPVDLRDAARLIIRDPVYLCPRGDLWITRDDAAPTPVVLKAANNEQVHVVRDRVMFVHWATAGGAMAPTLIIQDGRKLLRVDFNGRKPLSFDRAFDWSRAFSWFGRIAVPSNQGASIIDPGKLTEHFVAISDETIKAPVRILLDARGVLAWRVDGPAARFVDDQWSALTPDNGWPTRIVELMPLLDGSVVQLIRSDQSPDQEAVELRSVSLEAAVAIDEHAVVKLIAQLSDDEDTKRDNASAELARYGPAVWSILDRERAKQPLEGQGRIEELLATKIKPRLGRLTPTSDDLQPACYLRDGGVVLYSNAGVEMPRGNGETRLTAPAWIAVRPGRSVQLLAPALTDDAMLGKVRFDAWGEEWIITDEIAGPRRFMGNHVAPLVAEPLRRFNKFFGIDSRGRWILIDDAANEALIIDPFIADETPRLPVWTITVEGGSIGWNDQNWPVQKLGGAWALVEDRWQTMKDDEPIRTFAPRDTPTTAPADTPLLEEPDGTKWFDGQTHLRVIRGGEKIEFELPPEALGSMPATLIRTADRLFLFNAPGRVLRFRETPSSDPPLKLEGVFTQDIPNTDEPTRIWLDPAARLVIAHGGNKLAVLFPEGRVPPAIAKMMPVTDE